MIMAGIDEFAERIVRKGAALLDRVSSDWWSAERVNLATLDISSGSLCLLAQSFGGYCYGIGVGLLEKLLRDAGAELAFGEVYDLAPTHGFCAAFYEIDMTEFPDMADMRKDASGQVFIKAEAFTAPWVKVISARREAASVSDPILDLIAKSE